AALIRRKSGFHVSSGFARTIPSTTASPAMINQTDDDMHASENSQSGNHSSLLAVILMVARILATETPCSKSLVTALDFWNPAPVPQHQHQCSALLSCTIIPCLER